MQKLRINADGGRWYSNAIGCDFRQICKIWKTGKIQKIHQKSPKMAWNWPKIDQIGQKLIKIGLKISIMVHYGQKRFCEIGARELDTFKNLNTFTIQKFTKIADFLKIKRASMESKMSFLRRESRQWF